MPFKLTDPKLSKFEGFFQWITAIKVDGDILLNLKGIMTLRPYQNYRKLSNGAAQNTYDIANHVFGGSAGSLNGRVEVRKTDQGWDQLFNSVEYYHISGVKHWGWGTVDINDPDNYEKKRYFVQGKNTKQAIPYELLSTRISYVVDHGRDMFNIWNPKGTLSKLFRFTYPLDDVTVTVVQKSTDEGISGAPFVEVDLECHDLICDNPFIVTVGELLPNPPTLHTVYLRHKETKEIYRTTNTDSSGVNVQYTTLDYHVGTDYTPRRAWLLRKLDGLLSEPYPFLGGEPLSNFELVFEEVATSATNYTMIKNPIALPSFVYNGAEDYAFSGFVWYEGSTRSGYTLDSDDWNYKNEISLSRLGDYMEAVWDWRRDQFNAMYAEFGEYSSKKYPALSYTELGYVEGKDLYTDAPVRTSMYIRSIPAGATWGKWHVYPLSAQGLNPVNITVTKRGSKTYLGFPYNRRLDVTFSRILNYYRGDLGVYNPYEFTAKGMAIHFESSPMGNYIGRVRYRYDMDTFTTLAGNRFSVDMYIYGIVFDSANTEIQEIELLRVSVMHGYQVPSDNDAITFKGIYLLDTQGIDLENGYIIPALLNYRKEDLAVDASYEYADVGLVAFEEPFIEYPLPPEA